MVRCTVHLNTRSHRTGYKQSALNLATSVHHSLIHKFVLTFIPVIITFKSPCHLITFTSTQVSPDNIWCVVVVSVVLFVAVAVATAVIVIGVVVVFVIAVVVVDVLE